MDGRGICHIHWAFRLSTVIAVIVFVAVPLTPFYGVSAQVGDNVETFTPSMVVKTTECFFVSFNDAIFNNSDMIDHHSPIKYRPSLLSMPDLPKWMNFMYSNEYRDGFIYGVPEKEEDLTVEVVATNTETFQTSRRFIHILVRERHAFAKYEVQMRFSNMNVEEMFVDDRLERLLEIFFRRLWKGSRDLYVTLVESAVSLGGRRPPNPKEKDGVVVRLGAAEDFSRELKNLEREVMTIRNREPCPKDYKRTSAERFFRDEEFIPDWCGFRLLFDGKHNHDAQEPAYSPILLSSNDFHPPLPMAITRDFMVDFLLCVILPTTLAFGMAAALSLTLFGRREGVEKRNRNTPSVQMVQYASIHRATHNLRGLTGKRDGATPGATTPSSTLPRSFAGSPNNTLVKNNAKYMVS